MTAPDNEQFGFAPDYDSPVPYMQRTRDYYTAIGYTTPYRWAHYVDAPFQKLKKPLAQSRVTIITTAAPYDPAKGDQGPGAAYNGGAKFYKVYDGDTAKQHDLRISHIGYDRKHTSATDNGTWFPLPQLIKAQARGTDRRGRAALLRRADQSQPSRHHRYRRAGDPGALPRRQGRRRRAGAELPGVPPDHGAGRAASRGQRHPDRGDGMRQGYRRARRGAALPVLAISRSATPPASRMMSDSQALTLELALGLLESAVGARTTMQSPLRWSADASWKLDYNNVAQMSPEELARRRAEFDRQKEIARGNRAA